MLPIDTQVRDRAQPVSDHDIAGARRATLVPLVVWTAVVCVGAALVYTVLVEPGRKRLDGVPLHATFDPFVGWRTLVPIGVLAVAALGTTRLRSLPWRAFLGAWWIVAAVWAVALAVARNPRRLSSPFEHRGEYLAAVPQIGSISAFLETFVERIASYPVHVQGHPPGFVIIAWALDAIGAGGPLPLAVLVVAVGAASVPLVLGCTREVVGEEWARAAAPFLAIGPMWLWISTSADAFFTGVGAAAVLCVVLATGRFGAPRIGFALAGGLLFGACIMLSYGLVLLAAVPLSVAIARRSLDTIAVAVAGGAVVVALAAGAGFWWVDGLFATRERYLAGIASDRPDALFLVANVSILLLALGPAIAVAVWRLRERSCWLVVGGALVALALADLSGMSKSEVERIWLPFMPFVVVSAGVFARRTLPASATRAAGTTAMRTLDGSTGWLVLQGATAIVLESVVRTAW